MQLALVVELPKVVDLNFGINLEFLVGFYLKLSQKCLLPFFQSRD
jgi:hypothetical protein